MASASSVVIHNAQTITQTTGNKNESCILRLEEMGIICVPDVNYLYLYRR